MKKYVEIEINLITFVAHDIFTFGSFEGEDDIFAMFDEGEAV